MRAARLGHKLQGRDSLQGFASDNAAPVHPAVLEAIAAANSGHAFGYGHDAYTHQVLASVGAVLGDRAQAFFVFNGSAANVLALRAACRPWEAVICAAGARSTPTSAERPRRSPASSC